MALPYGSRRVGGDKRVPYSEFPSWVNTLCLEGKTFESRAPVRVSKGNSFWGGGVGSHEASIA